MPKNIIFVDEEQFCFTILINVEVKRVRNIIFFRGWIKKLNCLAVLSNYKYCKAIVVGGLKMKYCHMMQDYLYLDNYEGGIALCPWMDPSKSCIGNLMKDEIEDAYNSDYANYLRSTMDDQTFRYCRPEACPYIQNNSLEEISEEEYNRRKKDKYQPTIINLAYDFVCNQHCETCRKSVFVPPADYADKMNIIREKITPYMERAHRITASGHGDPFASRYMMDVLAGIKPTNPDMSLLLETNGVFFDEAHWKCIEHLSQVRIELIVTINSFDEFTYKHISRGGNYRRVMDNLVLMSKLRRENKIAHLTNTLVIQDRNFREIPSFIKKSFEEYAFDRVILIPVYQWGTMGEDAFWFKDVLNPMHPYHKEYLEIMQEPILKDARVFHFGGDTIHPARPYPSGMTDKYFPYHKVKKGSKVVVYGAGQIGRIVIDSLKQNKYCEVLLWIDKCGDGKCIMKPDALAGINAKEYDCIILATINPAYKFEMRNNLKDMGIADEIIISCCE